MTCFSRQAFRSLILASLGLLLMGADSVPPVTIAVTCLNHDSGVCRLVSPTVGLTVTVKSGDANIQYYAPAPEGFVERSRTQVRPDLEARVGSGVMSPDEANLIFAEILANPFVAYRLPPNAETLNQDVGFAPNVQLSPQDQIEVLRAHLQMSLSVSPATSRYLSDGLGLQVIEPMKPVNSEDPNLISESQVLLARPTVEAQAPGPEAQPGQEMPSQAQPPGQPQPQPSIESGSLPAPIPPPLKTNPPTERITHEESKSLAPALQTQS